MKKLFLFLLSVVGALTAQAQTSPYTGSEVGEGDFYLYNVGTGLWIQNIDANNRRSDDNWNTGAGMGTAGFDFALTAVDGGYNLDPKENPRKLGWGYGDGGILYLDGNIGDNTHWDFTKVEAVSNGYKISIDDHVLGVEVVEGKAFLINNATENDVWQLVTKAERLEKMQTLATEGKPYDLSFLLGDWNFATNNTRRSQWVEKRDGGNDDGFPRARRWNSSHLVWNTNSYSWTQTVSDLPNGVYQFSVQGMYRDGNRNQVGAKAAEGKTELLAKYFIGAAEGSLMSILAQASETKGDGFETAIENTDPQLYAPDNADNWTIVWALHPDKYWNAPVKVNVRGGSVEVGVRKTSIIGGDWLAMNEFKLEYVGPIDATIYKEALQTAITTAEGFKGTTTEALATALATALSDAKALVESDDIDAIEAKTNALNTARSAAEAVNPTDLIATIALAKAEGIDVTAAEEVAKTATEAAPVNEALNSLRLARQIKAADKAENVWAGNAPAAGDFYIYNVGQKRFLCGGADWGAHAALGFPGINVTLVGEGEYRLDTHLNNGGEKEFLGYNGYCDTDAQDTWKFIQVSEGVYNIARTADNNLLLGYTTNTFANVDTDKADGADPNNQWILVTKADRDALIAKASKSNPVDVSYLIQSPGFNQREAIDKWKMEGYSIWGRGGNHPDFICESWNTTSNKLTQTIENLPAGIYQVSVQGYFRDGDHENQVVEAQSAAQLATFAANGVSVLLPNILSGVNKAPGLGSKTEVGEFPYNATEAANFFRNGLYKNSITVLVGEDGKLEISISKDSKNFDRDWVVVDNFRLTYLGNDAAEVNYLKALATIKDGAVYRIKATVGDETFYLTQNGTVAKNENAAGGFQITQKAGGALQNIGFLVDGGNARFSNPPGTSESNLKCGYISPSDATRADYDAQVFFLNNDGKYAIRATNVGAGATSGWAWVASSYWTVEKPSEDAANYVAQYQWEPAYIWELDYVCDAETYATRKATDATVQTWITTIQTTNGLVQDGSKFTSNAKEPSEGEYANLVDGKYDTYFHSTWSGAANADHYLQAELPEAKKEFYFYFKKRHNNNNNRPIDLIISGSNDAEGEFTKIAEINEGMPIQAQYIDYLSNKISSETAYKYIRFTIVDTNNHANDKSEDGGHKFFTFSEFYMLPTSEPEFAEALTIAATPAYMRDPEKVQAADTALKALLNSVKVTYELYETEGTEPIQTEVVVQKGGSEVAVPAGFKTAGYYDYTAEAETVGTEDCTIKVIRSFKEGLVQKLENLSNAKAYTIACDRGAFVAKDGNMCSTALNGLGDAAPSNIAIISYEDNYYFYSVADQKFVTNTGALADMPTHGAEDAVVMTAKTVPYFLCQFNAEGKVLNTNGNAPLGYVINSWNTPDAGNQYYMIEAADFDATAALAALEAFFNPSYLVTYEVKDEAGKVLFTSEEIPTTLGAEISTLPADYQRAFTKYTLNGDPVTISEEKTTVTFTAAWDGPVPVAEDYESIKWQNLYLLRGENRFYLANEGAPGLVKNPEENTLTEEEYQWGFIGDAYAGLKIYNKYAGAELTLTNTDDGIVMAEGEFVWDIIAKNGEGILFGISDGYINQYGGGESTTLGLWGSATDAGSTYYAEEVQIPAIVLNAPSFVVGKEAVAEGTQTEPNMMEKGTKLQIKTGATNILVNNYTAKELAVKLTVMMMGDLPNAEYGSTTAHIVRGETVEVDLGTKDFPIELKPGYVYQNIAVLAAELVVKETGETVATYDGAPVQLHWVGVKGDENGIKDIKALQGAEIYDLGGSKTQKIQKGKAYIIDGKTYIAK